MRIGVIGYGYIGRFIVERIARQRRTVRDRLRA